MPTHDDISDIIQSITQRIRVLSADGESNPRDLSALSKVLKDLHEYRQKMPLESKLSPEERERRINEILGFAPENHRKHEPESK